MQILHNIGKERLELVNSMAPYVTAKVLPILKDTTTCWQPADYLPKPESETFLDEVRAVLPETGQSPALYLMGDCQDCGECCIRQGLAAWTALCLTELFVRFPRWAATLL